MKMTTHDSHPAEVDAGDHDHGTPRGPEDWPLTLQVAVAFWTVTVAVIVHGTAGGALWFGFLAAIAIDYGVYLRTDGGAIVAILARAPWNGEHGARDVGTGASEGRVRITDISVGEMMSFARDEIRERSAVARPTLAAVTPGRKAHLLRVAAAAAGVIVALVQPALGLCIAILAGLDALLHARLGVSAAALPFDDERDSDDARGATVTDGPHVQRNAPASPESDESNVVSWRHAA